MSSSTERNGLVKNPGRIRVGDRVTIYRRGKSGIWCADFWFDDEHRRTSLKTQNKKVAIQRAVKLDNELIDGSFRTSATNTLIVDAISDYLTYLQNENRARKTIVRYRGELNGFYDFCLGRRARRLTQITPTLFDRYRAGLKTRHKPGTVYHESVVVKQFLRWSISRRLIADDPLADYKLQKPVSEPKPAPSLPEVWQFLDAAKEPLRARLAVLAFTGMRSGELQRLRMEDVDLAGPRGQRGEVFVPVAVEIADHHGGRPAAGQQS